MTQQEIQELAGHRQVPAWVVKLVGDCFAKERKQEPVAWGMQNDDGNIYDCITPEEHARLEGEYTTPLYTHPPKVEQEPVTWESLLGAIARGWCYEENANKTMDSELALAIAKEVSTLFNIKGEA